jgi:hypothetical protein
MYATPPRLSAAVASQLSFLRRSQPGPQEDRSSCEGSPGNGENRAGQLTTETDKIDGPSIPKLTELQELPSSFIPRTATQMIAHSFAGPGMIPGEGNKFASAARRIAVAGAPWAMHSTAWVPRFATILGGARSGEWAEGNGGGFWTGKRD